MAGEATFVQAGADGFAIAGDLDRFSVPQLWLQRQVLWGNDTTRLSLASVGHTDTAGLAFLVALQAEAQQLGRSFTLTDLPAQLQAAARVSDLDRLLPLPRAEGA